MSFPSSLGCWKAEALNVTSSSSQGGVIVQAWQGTNKDAHGGSFSSQVFWEEKHRGKSLLQEPQKLGETGLSWDVKGHGEKMLLSI